VSLLDGTYVVTLGITSYDEGVVYDWREEELYFEVMNPSGAVGYANLPIEIAVTPTASTVMQDHGVPLGRISRADG
jgi:hypothetical protein